MNDTGEGLRPARWTDLWREHCRAAEVAPVSLRAEQMLDDSADVPLVRYPLQPYQRRVLGLRRNFTAYDGFYVALAESLGIPLLVDDHKESHSAAPTPVGLRFELFVQDVEASVRFYRSTLGLEPPQHGHPADTCPSALE